MTQLREVENREAIFATDFGVSLVSTPEEACPGNYYLRILTNEKFPLLPKRYAPRQGIVLTYLNL